MIAAFVSLGHLPGIPSVKTLERHRGPPKTNDPLLGAAITKYAAFHRDT